MGVAFGKSFILDRSKVCVIKSELEPPQIEDEIQRFRDAIHKSKQQIQETKERAGKGADKFGVMLDTYVLLLEDEVLVKDTIDNIRSEFVNAEYAINMTLEKYVKLFDNINDEYLKGKKDDLELVVQRIIRNLLGHEQETLDKIDQPVILIAHQLSPSDMLMIDKNHIHGLVTEAGGKTSHLGIIASAMGIPAVVGAKDVTQKINSGDLIIVDGIDGQVVPTPSNEDNRKYRKKCDNYKTFEDKLLEDIKLPAKTLDGCHVKLLANIESAHEIKTITHFGAEGIGLYRTEFLYLGRQKLPDENELYEDFKKVVQGMDQNPVTIRTLDIGGDKMPHAIELEEEDNPTLGLRGIRMSLTFPDLLTCQMRALLRASLYGKIKILYPMVSFPDEIIEANRILEKVKSELRQNQIPFDESIQVGAMIETPASAISIDHILDQVDFISIGTNDLIQYILAVDRINENVAHLYQPFHPSIIKILGDIFLAASIKNKEVSICGQLGGDPLATELLLGLGKINQLSMDPHSIPRVKKIIRGIKMDRAKKLADHVRTLSSTEEINSYLLRQMKQILPFDFNRDTQQN
tara:strand:+ start:193 stop:1923 length:1731 start_codon:yes stop_codon:yes gene_type:complete